MSYADCESRTRIIEVTWDTRRENIVYWFSSLIYEVDRKTIFIEHTIDVNRELGEKGKDDFIVMENKIQCICRYAKWNQYIALHTFAY